MGMRLAPSAKANPDLNTTSTQMTYQAGITQTFLRRAGAEFRLIDPVKSELIDPSIRNELNTRSSQAKNGILRSRVEASDHNQSLPAERHGIDLRFMRADCAWQMDDIQVAEVLTYIRNTWGPRPPFRRAMSLGRDRNLHRVRTKMRRAIHQ
jgi:hypothetical protein